MVRWSGGQLVAAAAWRRVATLPGPQGAQFRGKSSRPGAHAPSSPRAPQCTTCRRRALARDATAAGPRSSGVTMRTAVAAIFVVVIALGAHALYEPCGKGEACAEGECCMLTGIRYGTPACHSLRESGAVCRPNAKPENYTLSSSPFGGATLYTDVYWAVCPCQSGLQCADGTCA